MGLGEGVLIVHHRPGSPGAALLLERLASTLESLGAGPVGLVEVESLPEGAPEWRGPVSALFALPGGHLREALQAYPWARGPLPPWLLALHVARHAPGGGVELAYYEARRMAGEKRRAAEEVARLLARLGVEATVHAYPPGPPCMAPVAPLSMGPGRLTRTLEARGCRRLPAILEGSLDLVASWILGGLEGNSQGPVHGLL